MKAKPKKKKFIFYSGWLTISLALLFPLSLSLSAATSQPVAGASPASPAAAAVGAVGETGKTIIAVPISGYRLYLEHHQPLDRLYCRGETCLFLVDRKELQLVRDFFRDRPGRLDQPQAGLYTYREYGPGESPQPDIERLHTMEPSEPANGLYHDYAETVTELYELQNSYPGLAQVFSAGQSIEGREIVVIKISDHVQVDEGIDKGLDEPNIFITGCHHAREWISVEVPLLFARYILENYPADAQVKRAVEGAQIFILPLLNPDGLEFSIHTYRFWRKNRRYNGNLSWGVDLNRNYGYYWGYDDMGSSPDIFQETYRGTAPFSEPETASLQSLAWAHPPAGSINYHSFSQKILFPWSYTVEAAPDDAKMRQLAGQMSQLMLPVNGREYAYGSSAGALYLTNGDADDWLYGTFGTMALTIELPPSNFFFGWFFTFYQEISRTFAENLPALLYFVNYFIASNPPGR